MIKALLLSTLLNVGEFIPSPPSPRIEARKRGGKGKKGRRRGGNGLR